jgi:uncharacterized membrane protein YraQ (UPF0718 family)
MRKDFNNSQGEQSRRKRKVLSEGEQLSYPGKLPGSGQKPGFGGRRSPKEYLLLGVMGVIFVLINFFYPLQAGEVYSVSLSYLQEMVLIIPPVFILMGLFEVWIPKEFIQKYMGKEAGLKGIALAFTFGTIPTGPIYIAFPLAAVMLKKGARMMNVVVFLGIWAAAKLPQLMVEIKFLGPAFTALRLVLTVASVIVIGFLVEYFMKEKKSQEVLDNAVIVSKPEKN